MRVERYDMGGLTETLPNMIEGRTDHACGSYLRMDGTQVSVGSVCGVHCTTTSKYIFLQVLLVAGGQNTHFETISSTEVLVGDSPSWTMATPLPFAAHGLSATTLSNTLYMSGKEKSIGPCPVSPSPIFIL